jgi:hypothetical protein
MSSAEETRTDLVDRFEPLNWLRVDQLDQEVLIDFLVAMNDTIH